ncbi:uncharacterized protein LOC110849723 isoform X2 [Folsomia candida]|uniref:uncharacterized protein LOC110849723 isoform X2 n=1 Tax=Folsomia candida TaxID=158441 RepID=UPI001605257B|nr:uncharacterized protein LOC110849723 isoform X2 [Folsomia candida]XP_035707835.1 uncharacterized protein LOC110849723 isoform X2 [Folsomia candida]
MLPQSDNFISPKRVFIFFQFIIILIPASFIFSAAYVVVAKDFDINAATPSDSVSQDYDEFDTVTPSFSTGDEINPSRSSWLTQFEQEYFGFFFILCGPKSGASSDMKLFRFTAGYFALIYLIMQCILGGKLMQGERDLHYWKLQAWWEGQVGIFLVSVYLNVCILGQQDDSVVTLAFSRRLSTALTALTLFTYISYFVMIWTVYQFTKELKLKGIVYPDPDKDGKKEKLEKSKDGSQFTKDLQAILDWLKNAQLNNNGLHPAVLRCNVMATYLVEKMVKFGNKMDESLPHEH